MDKKNLVIIVLAMLLVAIISGGAVYLLTQDGDDVVETNDAASSSLSLEADQTPKDDNISQLVESENTLEIVLDDETLLIQAMSDRHTKDPDDIDITIEGNDGEYANGYVGFAGEIGGGWWLAAWDGNSWTIVADGNGTVLCDDIVAYDFPVSMVPECWDETTMSLVTR